MGDLVSNFTSTEFAQPRVVYHYNEYVGPVYVDEENGYVEDDIEEEFLLDARASENHFVICMSTSYISSFYSISNICSSMRSKLLGQTFDINYWHAKCTSNSLYAYRTHEQ